MSRIARASLIIAVFFGVDKILGFVRQVLIAREFGLTYQIDVFNAANNIPDLLSALISGGALGVALIPVLSEYLQLRSRQAAWDLFSRILNLAFISTGVLSLTIAVFAEPLVHRVIAPGFPPEQLALTVRVMRLDLIAILIFSISGLIMAGLQANQHFLLPAMAPMFYNLGQIFGIAILAPETGYSLGPVTLPAYGLGIYGLVYGVLIGAAMHLAIQVPGLIAYRFRWTPAINLRNPGVIQVLHLLGPRILTMFFLQVFFVTRDNIASRYGEGAITALNYGWFIMQVPETLIGTAIAIALLPTISEQFARGEEEAYRDTVNHAVRVILALTLPVATLLILTIRPLIAGIFGFDDQGTQLVFLATSAYLLGLAGHSLLEVSARSFYARQDARTPLFAAAINAVAYIFLAIWLANWFGPPGIALANTLAFTGEALFLLFLLNRKVPGMLRLGSTLLRTALASLSGGLLVFSLMQLSSPSVLWPLVGLAAGGLLALPFIWPELKLLIRL
jgi:putative peptidoglycan lipid II flippase